MKDTGLKLRRLQLLELEALKKLDGFFRENGIQYYLRGGSALGAVKYGGFVPWDDDMDVIVPRDSYEKLLELLKREHDFGKFTIESYHYNQDTHCYFPRVVLSEAERKRMNLVSNSAMGLIIIDIVPIDGTPDSFLKRMWYYLVVYFYRTLAASWTIEVKEVVNHHSKIRLLIFNLLSKLKVNRLCDQNTAYKRMDMLFKKNNWKNSRFSGSIMGSLGIKEIFSTKCWGKGKLLKFEDSEFPVPARYDDYLRRMYGKAYLTELPSEKKRKTHLGKNRLQ